MSAWHLLADPALTVGLPPEITAAVGMIAFVHNFEAWFCPFYHPFSDGVALSGPLLCAEWLLNLRSTIGIPHTADAVGVTEELVPLLAGMAARDLNVPENPRPVTAADAEEIYRNALYGRLS